MPRPHAGLGGTRLAVLRLVVRDAAHPSTALSAILPLIAVPAVMCAR